VTDTPEDLRRALDVVTRRIDRALDRNDRRLFIICCQHRTQLLHRLAEAEDKAFWVGLRKMGQATP